MKNKDIVVVIPTLNPNVEIMSDFINKLVKSFSNIIVINDGSRDEYNDLFDSFKKKNIIVLKNHINYGKGRSLKTALNYILNEMHDIKAIVTADSDGQHSVEDIIKVGKSSIKNPNAYVLGSRDFDEEIVPFKSRYGNKITRNVFKIFVGLNITDTQTGLRGMSPEVAKNFLDTPGERFEYESNTLIECKERNIPIVEETIKTIYINDNSESHFNPIKDSIKIYKLFIKYIFSSVSSFVVDILLFTLFLSLLKGKVDYAIIISTIIARVISSIYNYYINSKAVFKNKGKNSIIKYFILVVIQMFASAFIVDTLFNKVFNSGVTVIKIIVDILIFVVNFFVQREWVFKNN